ncbi:MAG: ferredoxin--NADP reductase [Pseudohongiella sp.]|nr:ferredoxin--NADP reductase [Pseudohongiella sp.]MDO9519225.1 ferredoxin--NADP reductase [Pseudohongiella sp.]MDP2128336.1 ferredoxin--NADP reductase [Pseudohongiella sp.]
MTDWVKGVVAANTHWTDNLFSLRIEANVEPFDAGQYTWLALDSKTEQEAESSGQPYSILSSPSEQTLEFFFYTHIEGDLSQYLSQLNPGEQLWVKRQPAGNLTLSSICEANVLCLLATGTGVAPFISMLKTAEPWQRFEQVVLAYAVREVDDLRYRNLFDALSAKHGKRFRLIPFVSRESPAALKLPDAIHGRIPACLESGEFETVLGTTLAPENSQIMLCGNPGMVKDAIAVLVKRGFNDNRRSDSNTNPDLPGQLTYEAYW